ncbi:hypothetical protein HPP92_019447 [Vanilla planifolia]|uniref:Zinc-finger domain-containing protein n=1 Tax=Vanilla planifolia TaxID=51239 RepID=A0A835Q2B4_VANPL|nr:hypothetical protein HPP92_019447 [Vanilla planifolia]
MVSTRMRTLKANSTAIGGEGTPSGYEKCRSERIKENMERMKQLGIINLSVKFKSETDRVRPLRLPRIGTPSMADNSPTPEPRRRSSRLQNVLPISYSEIRAARDVKHLSDDSTDWLREGQKQEVYNEDHEKLLGSCEKSWTLFVDGYNSDGKRIYDHVVGKTCHQCRQKTLGHHTSCSKCNMVQGQFCGDCLYMRYGENVLEVEENTSWICPVCRGICNCSICRVKKGWLPTGPLYKKVSTSIHSHLTSFVSFIWPGSLDP